MARSDPRRDRAIVERLSRWFADHARDLPWRATGADGRRDPYRALVSEVMLQQTQVARVQERYGSFLARFPTVEHLARAREQSVLAAWSGLGYYRRARALHAAAKEIVREHRGRVPDEPADLRRLPGVGRYTAGAVASLVFGQAEPIVDGNVARVLTRLDGMGADASAPNSGVAVWDRAGALVERAAQSAGATVERFNEGLMELGATVCTPRSPRCCACPLASLCRFRRENTHGRDARATVSETGRDARTTVSETGRDARGTVSGTGRDARATVSETGRDARGTVSGTGRDARGTVSETGRDARTTVRGHGRSARVPVVLVFDTVIVEDGRGRRLVERRGEGGIWAGLWQPPTLETRHRAPRLATVQAWAGGPVERVGAFERLLTHRRVRFRVWRGVSAPAEGDRAAYRTRRQIGRLALSSPHRRILLEM